MRKTTLILILAIMSCSLVRADGTSKELDQELRRMLELTGAAKIGTQVMDQLIASFRTSMPNVPAEFWSEFKSEIQTKDLEDMVIPIYAKHLTLEEAKAANAFYSSPEGRSMVQKLPLIMSESMQAGQHWGQQIAKRALERLQAKGLIPKES